MSELRADELDSVEEKLSFFFPSPLYDTEKITEMLSKKEVVIDKAEIHSYLESALRTESPVEVEIDDNPNVFFSRFCDIIPQNVDPEKPYKVNSYLDAHEYLLVLPVESGMGNFWVRRSKRVVLRIFTPQYAVELGVYFEGAVDLTEGHYALRMSFPEIGRIVHDSREFRAQVHSKAHTPVVLIYPKSGKAIEGRLHDVSLHGAGIRVSRAVSKKLAVANSLSLEIYNNNECVLKVDAFVRHLSKRRTLRNVVFILGVEFGLITTALELEIEALVAQVQRYHLQEVAERSETGGVTLVE